MKISIFTIFLTVFVAESHQKTRQLFYYNVTLVTNEKYINESSITIPCEIHTRKKPCNFAPSVKFYLIQDFIRVYAQIKAIDINSNKVILDQLLNFCMFDNQIFDLLIKIILDQLREHLSFQMKCPFKQGTYETFSFKQEFGVFLSLFSLNQPQRYIAHIKGKIGKKIENIVKYSVDFEIIEVDN